MTIEKINIDFQVLDTHDPRVLSIADYSEWAQISEKPAIVEIILPGTEEPVVHYFDKQKINIFNSNTLQTGCKGDCLGVELVDLPDGIYEITVKGSPDTFNKTRKYLRTELTRLDLDAIYLNLNLLCKNKDRDLMNTLIDIDLLLRSAESNVRYDNICSAQELLFKAQELIKEAKNCSGCVDA